MADFEAEAEVRQLERLSDRAPEVSATSSVFERWPSCEHCGQRMMMVTATQQGYAFICCACPYRTSIPKT